MDIALFEKQIQELQTDFMNIMNRSRHHDLSDISPEQMSNFLTKAKATVNRITGKNSEYYEDITSILQNNVQDGIKLRAIMGSLDALLSDLKKGYFTTFREIIHADVFSDFIEMSEYLHEEGYKDASAVIIGSTLEAHLKKLCIKNNISLIQNNSSGKENSKKASTMNSDLSKLNIYNKIVEKEITAWLGIRNDAAHGNYSNYDLKQVKLMIAGISNFISNNPA